MAPFANYPDFKSCVSDQMRKHKGMKGFKIENARRICGAIQARVEGKGKYKK